MSDDIDGAVATAVQEALALDDDEVTPEAKLMGDLEAESIDLLDILFRIGRSTGVKLEASDLAVYIEGGIPEQEFGADGIVTDKGLEHLNAIMPQIDPVEMSGKLETTDVIMLFTVQNLVDMVSARAAT